MHVDVNNAFLSWTAVEMLKQGSNIDIRTIPAIIGGDEAKRKGVVLAKSNIAKQFGIKTGEPIYFARKKCPKIEIYTSNFNIYKKYSNQLYNLLLEYTDIIERFSIDECFLDLSKYLNKNENIKDKAIEIKERVKNELGFTVNVGVSSNKLLAKMASDFQKPDRVHTLFQNEIKEKMWDLPISELFMVGRKMLPKLQRMGIYKIGDLAKQDLNKLISIYGKYGKMIWEYANGISNEEVNNKIEKPKGIGNSITLPHDISDILKLEEVLLGLTEQVTYRLRTYGLLANVINVQIKNNEFKVYSHQRKIHVATDSTKVIYEEAKKLLEQLHYGQEIRLIGIRVDSLISKEEKQISIFNEQASQKQEKIDGTIDKLKQKYGYDVITRAGSLKVKNQIIFKDE